MGKEGNPWKRLEKIGKRLGIPNFFQSFSQLPEWSIFPSQRMGNMGNYVNVFPCIVYFVPDEKTSKKELENADIFYTMHDSDIANCNVYIITVPTPVDKNNKSVTTII